jgi:ABC-type uncharacterized transport system ATPase subunit
MSDVAPLLSVSGLVVRYGAIAAVRGIDLSVDRGQTVAIVGPNGAGQDLAAFGDCRDRPIGGGQRDIRRSYS